MNTIITLEHLVELDKRLEDAQNEVMKLDIAITQLLKIYTELTVGMKLIVTKEAREHLGGAAGVGIGHSATITRIWISSRGNIGIAVEYDGWGTNIQSLERVQAMRAEYLKQ